MEFYNKIKLETYNGSVLSGIVGDAWAGGVNLPEINNGFELSKLGYTHGLNIDNKYCKLKDTGYLKEKFYLENKEKLQDERWRIVFFVRMKLMLLRYLVEVPYSCGFAAWSPFLDLDICIAMLNLTKNERNNRKWQYEFFERNNLIISNENKRIDKSNVLDLTAQRNIPVAPLNISLLSGIIEKSFVEKVNNGISRKPIKYFPWYDGTIYSKVDIFIHFFNRKVRNAYTWYLILKPIENILKRVNGVCD